MDIHSLQVNAAYTLNAYNQTFWITFLKINENNILIGHDIESNTKMYFPIEDITGINISFNKPGVELNTIKNNLFEAVFSKKELKDNYLKLSKEAALIVVSNPDNDNFKKLNFFSKELYVAFYDSEEDSFYPSVSESIIKTLKNFVFENLDKKFIICCEAGISRSAGIAKAVEVLSGIEIGGIDSFKRYRPNKFLFKRLIS